MPVLIPAGAKPRKSGGRRMESYPSSIIHVSPSGYLMQALGCPTCTSLRSSGERTQASVCSMLCSSCALLRLTYWMFDWHHRQTCLSCHSYKSQTKLKPRVNCIFYNNERSHSIAAVAQGVFSKSSMEELYVKQTQECSCLKVYSRV